MSSVFKALASFSRPARGSIFCNVPLKEGLKFHYELEPFNARDENSIVLMSVADCHLDESKVVMIRFVQGGTTERPHPHMPVNNNALTSLE